MTLRTTTVAPSTDQPCCWARMPMMVSMQVPRAVATRSVGEKDSPRPWLSSGASVTISVADGA